jgi:hypothetical protein
MLLYDSLFYGSSIHHLEYRESTTTILRESWWKEVNQKKNGFNFPKSLQNSALTIPSSEGSTTLKLSPTVFQHRTDWSVSTYGNIQKTKMFKLKFALLYVATAILTAAISAQSGADYLDASPATVYEDTVMSPQNM